MQQELYAPAPPQNGHTLQLRNYIAVPTVLCMVLVQCCDSLLFMPIDLWLHVHEDVAGLTLSLSKYVWVPC